MPDITHLNFEAELVNASLTQPVLLDIWAPWCGPCKTLGPTLENLETEYAGRFKLVKLNADDEPEIAQQLSQMFGVRSIPFCVLFKAGQPADGFVGALPEDEVRKFLDKHVAEAEPTLEESQGDVDVEPAVADDPEVVIEKLAAASAANPANDTMRYDHLRALLDAGRVEEARAAWEPVSKSPVLDPRLVAVGHWISALQAEPTARTIDALAAALATNKRDFDSRFELAQIHFARREFTLAMDELLEILMRDKGWNDELARKNYVAVLQIMARPEPTRTDPPKAVAAAEKGSLELAGRIDKSSSDPVIDAYRRKLSMTIF
ncbi:MAG: tetratricopeptide repeat protein [Caldimonas sp.]